MALARSTIFSFSDEGSGGRRTGGYCRSDVDSSTSLRMTQRTLGMTVASPERQLLCQNDYGRVKAVRGGENGVSPGGLTGSEFIDARADLGLA